MEKKRRTTLAILLLLSIANFSRLTNNDNIRPIQFILIFVIGALSALLINELIILYKAKRQLKKDSWKQKTTIISVVAKGNLKQTLKLFLYLKVGF